MAVVTFFYHRKVITVNFFANNYKGFINQIKILLNDEFRAEPLKKKINVGPFYGVQIESAVHMTKGGVAANEKAEVLNNNDEVVEGLYAAGEVAASSAAYSASVIFGRVSGEEAARFILEK